MNNMIWLIRREVWENRSLWIAPLVVAGVILIIAAFGGVHVGNGTMLAWLEFGRYCGQDREHIRSAMDRATAKADHLRDPLSTFTAVQLFTMIIVLFFYLLIRCWRSARTQHPLLEVAAGFDTEVVLSKLLTAAVVTPVFVLLVSSALQVLFAGVWSCASGLDSRRRADGLGWRRLAQDPGVFRCCSRPASSGTCRY